MWVFFFKFHPERTECPATTTTSFQIGCWIFIFPMLFFFVIPCLLCHLVYLLKITIATVVLVMKTFSSSFLWEIVFIFTYHWRGAEKNHRPTTTTTTHSFPYSNTQVCIQTASSLDGYEIHNEKKRKEKEKKKRYE